MASSLPTQRLIRPSILALGLAAAALVLIVHVIVPCLVLERLNARLDQMPEHHGAFDKVSMQWWRGKVRLYGLRVQANAAPAALPPLIDAPDIDLSVTGLLSLDTPIRADLRALNPVATLIADAEGRLLQFGFGQDWVQLVQDLVPLPIQALRVENGSMRLFTAIDAQQSETMRLASLHGRIQRADDDAGIGATFKGELPDTGSVQVFAQSATAMPAHDARLRLRLSAVSLRQYQRAIEATTGIDIRQGTLHADISLRVRERTARGEIDATISQLDFGETLASAPFDWIAETILEAGVALVGEGERDTFRIRIPLQGPVQRPSTRTLQAVRDQLRQLVAAPVEWRIQDPSSQ